MSKNISDEEKEMYLMLCGWIRRPSNYYKDTIFYRQTSDGSLWRLDDAFKLQKHWDRVE